ncbi:MAG: ATP-binding cassette domain-containing protein [Eubacterium sp.]|nr:ATP-binding cassette domain-containing protein [Eubacterium sp.]
MSNNNANKPLLEVNNLEVCFGRGKNRVTAVNHINLEIGEGETYGLVGESGSGKSTIGKAILGLNPVADGSVVFEGEKIAGDGVKKPDTEIQKKIQMIFQDPMSSLNPRKKVRDIVAAGPDMHHMFATKEERDKKVAEILELVGMAGDHADRYPAQFSGGQRQRVGIARALIMQPKLIVADECIAALDASVQAQVVNLLKDIQKKTGTSFLFISHDLSMVRFLSDRIAVLHLGYLLETGTTDEIFDNPIHPYTRNLLAANPTPNPVVQKNKGMGYEYAESGLVYENGTWHDVNPEGTHQVWCEEKIWEKWRKAI